MVSRNESEIKSFLLSPISSVIDKYAVEAGIFATRKESLEAIGRRNQSFKRPATYFFEMVLPIVLSGSDSLPFAVFDGPIITEEAYSTNGGGSFL